MPDLPLTILVRVCRVTPRIFAPSVTDNPKGSRQALLTMRPGWAGFFMGMAFSPFFLVAVDQFNVKSVRSFKTKNDAPVGSHGHGPEPFQVAFERVQTITGKVEFLRRSCIVKYGQYFLNRIHQISAYPAPVVTFKEPFQAA